MKAVGLFSLMILGGCHSYLRQQRPINWDLDLDQRLGRHILAKAVAAHGGDIAYRQGPIEGVLVDHWFMPARIRRPWPRERIYFSVNPHQSTMFVAFSEEDYHRRRGWLWRDGEAFVLKNGREKLLKNPKKVFMIKAFAFLFGTPFKFLESEYDVRFAGRKAVSGEPLDWLRIQYRDDVPLFMGFDRETHRIASLISSAPLLAEGDDVFFEAQWGDYRRIGSLWVACDRMITARDGALNIHHVRIETLELVENP